MKKIVSYALFGDGNRYSRYLPALVRAHLNLFPIVEGWKLRIAYDDHVLSSPAGDLLRAFAWDGLIEIDYRGTAPLTRAMLWRMAPIFEDSVDYVFCRDVDSPPMPRDRVVADQFMKFGGSVGTAHDNVVHIGIMGGLCHFNAKQFREGTGLDFFDERRSWADSKMRPDWSKHGTDQAVLNRLVADSPKLTILEHRFHGWRDGTQGTEGRRDAGIWPHPERAWSSPMPGSPSPDVTSIKFGDIEPLPSDIRNADRLGAHLGCAHYDHEAAAMFWDLYGDPAIARRVKACEEADPNS